MKIRNGFVSNSSSSSFVIAFPKGESVPLRDMESYLGKVDDKLSPEMRDVILFTFWKSQYFDEEMYRRSFEGSGKKYDFHSCSAPWEAIVHRETWGCPGYMSKDEEGNPASYACEKCKYNVIEKRIARGDDYYRALDCLDDKGKTWLKKHEGDKIIYLDIDDNDPPRGLTYEVANEITSNAAELFTASDNVWCTGGK